MATWSYDTARRVWRSGSPGGAGARDHDRAGRVRCVVDHGARRRVRSQHRGHFESRQGDGVHGHVHLVDHRRRADHRLRAPWYYKAPNTGFDFSAGPGASISIFSLADGTYLCTTAGGTSVCQKSAQQAALGQNPAADFALRLQRDPTKFSASFTGSQSIASRQAQCFSVKSIAAGAFGDVSTCYSSSGVPLKATITASGSTITMEATAFSTNVTDADFALPETVR
jgi:hypothetical protein